MQSVQTLRLYPSQYYNSLKPKSYVDVFNSPTCTIGKYYREDGETKARAVICLMILDLTECFNIGKPMSAVQVARLADLILEKYSILKIDDFKLCFNEVISGKYGTIYDRIDVNVVLTWISTYLNERLNVAEGLSQQEHEKTCSRGEKRKENYNNEFLKGYDKFIESKIK